MEAQPGQAHADGTRRERAASMTCARARVDASHEPRLGISSQLNKRAMGSELVARHRPELDSKSRVQTAKIHALLLREGPGTYGVGDYSAPTQKKSRGRAGVAGPQHAPPSVGQGPRPG